jgi:ribosomal protein S4
MFFIKKKRFKPLYKKFLKLRENVQNRQKLLKLKRNKWQVLIKNYKRSLKRYKKFKPRNQNQYLVSKYPNRGTSYNKRHRNTLNVYKKLSLFYGGLNKKLIKKHINSIIKKNFRNKNIEFLESFEKRLDTVLYRSKFSPSFRNAQQLIVHGNVFVNGKKIKTKSYKLNSGDLISINPNCYLLIEENIRQTQIWPIPPKHLLINYKTAQIVMGNIEYTNLSNLFTFHLNLEKILNRFI